jgi:cardiolipin synthase
MYRWLRHLPNLITCLRIGLVAPIAVALAQHRLLATLCGFGVAAGSDALDGFLAKRFGWHSNLGAILDPLADKLLLATVFVMLAVLGSVPVWLAAAVIARDVIIILGALSYWRLLGPVAARPSLVSKLNTLCQVVFILTVIGAGQFSWQLHWSLGLGALVFVTTCVSGIDYVLVYGRLAAAQARARHARLATGGSTPA